MAQQQWPIKPKHTRLKIAVAAVLLSVAIACGFLIYIWIDTHTQSYFGPGPIEIKVKPNKPFFLQGENANFTVTVINNQTWPISHPLSKDAQIAKNGTIVNDSTLYINYFKMPTYPENSSTDFNWVWFQPRKDNQTLPHEIGNYTLTLSLHGIGYDASANCTFEIR